MNETLICLFLQKKKKIKIHCIQLETLLEWLVLKIHISRCQYYRSCVKCNGKFKYYVNYIQLLRRTNFDVILIDIVNERARSLSIETIKLYIFFCSFTSFKTVYLSKVMASWTIIVY